MEMKPGTNQRSKQTFSDFCWKILDPEHLLFYAHSLCMNCIIAMLLLVSSMSTNNHLLYFARFCARSTPKIAKKNIQQRTSLYLLWFSFAGKGRIESCMTAKSASPRQSDAKTFFHCMLRTVAHAIIISNIY